MADKVVNSINPSFCLSDKGALGLNFWSQDDSFSRKPFALIIFWELSAMFTHRQHGTRLAGLLPHTGEEPGAKTLLMPHWRHRINHDAQAQFDIHQMS